MSFLRKNFFTLVPIGLWILIFLGIWYLTNQYGVTAGQVIYGISQFLATPPLGPLIYLIMYIPQAIMLLPYPVLLVAAGFIYGPVWGFVMAIIGTVISTMTAYVVGIFYGPNLLPLIKSQSKIYQFAASLKLHGFAAVMTMRLFLLPLNLVSYFAGVMEIEKKAYIAATLLGIIFSVAGYVLIGSSLQWNTTTQEFNFDFRWLVISLIILAISPFIGWLMYRRQLAKDASLPPQEQPPQQSAI
jgi:uncharacterized membrane protein YdjX (TVP38/TMEM64 family)